MDEIKVLQLNEAQTKAVKIIKRFLLNKKNNDLLLLGCAGSGKTTVIINAFDGLTAKPTESPEPIITTKHLELIDTTKLINLLNTTLQSNQQIQVEQPAQLNQSSQVEQPAQLNQSSQVEQPMQSNQQIQVEQPAQLNQSLQTITYKYRIAFCAFTNKATQVLKNVSEKFHISFSAEFSTIHKLLRLEPKYLEKETEVAFTFDKNKLEHLRNYDIIIFDECSTISKELYNYIIQAREFIHGKFGTILKFIYLGDYWQLPPVGEELSIVFDVSIKQEWIVAKLTKVMRSGNSSIYSINQELLLWVDVFRCANQSIYKPYIEQFHKNYPYNLLPRNEYSHLYISYIRDLYDSYINTWRTNKQPDVVIVTYSRVNCEKINFAIQDIIDVSANREIPEKRTITKFYPGDRCCLDKPIEICSIKYKQYQNLNDTYIYVTLDTHTNEYLYNGEIFDVIRTEDVQCVTPLNNVKYKIDKFFPAQIISVCRINDRSVIYDILHIENNLINEAKKKLRTKTSRIEYIHIMTSFIKIYPKLDYGYCITIYKSQGSEWHTVIVNLNSIKWSIVGDHHDKTNIIDVRKKKALFKTTYTALSRASHELKLFWF
jgi:transcription-repair coupling factor (superfamily II helicase)